MTDLVVSLFRALVGKNIGINGKRFNSGVTDTDLLNRGMCFDNLSHHPIPYNERLRIYGKDTSDLGGLPVFLAMDTAVFWLTLYPYSNTPAIASAKLPLSVVFGESRVARLVTNRIHPDYENELTYQQIEDHITGRKIIGWQCFIASVENYDLRDLLRQYERFYRPKSMDKEGEIVVSAGFSEVILR